MNTQTNTKTKKHWTLDDIPWDRFDSAKVDPDVLKVVKAASMVEFNSGDYATYLCNVFQGDPEFQASARRWAAEEVQHGAALGRWARLADPSFDFDASFKRFTDGFKIAVDSTRSIRGSRSAELVTRCIVETGTSSYYAALMEAVEEPVLKEICRNIAADELRHYKLFYDNLRRYLEVEKIGRLRRLLVALTRMSESEDDELAYAYYAANDSQAVYDRRRYVRAYAGRTYSFYQPRHVQRAVSQVLKASGLTPNGRLAAVASRTAYRFMQYRTARFARAEA
jgi:rubrerythrin